MTTAIEDAADRTSIADEGTPASAAPRTLERSAVAGASPAVPRDPRLLEAEAAVYEARTAADEAEAARKAAEEAAARAAATKAAAEKRKAELAAAQAEAKAKAEAAALQVKLEREQEADAAASARAQNRARRDEKLGTVAAVPAAEPKVVTVTRRNTDRFAGALGLFLVRAALAAWVGIVGWQSLTDRQATIDALIKVGIPEASTGTLSWLVGIGLIGIAFFLLAGVATRVFAFLLLLGTIGFLTFFRFGPFSPFMEGHFGFFGDRDVFIAVMSLLLVLVGGGGWAVDARVRARRAANREAATVE